MLNILIKSYHHTNKFIILATPLILFSLISGVYLLFSINGNYFSQLCALLLFFFMLSSFLAGWFYMIAQSVKNDDFENPNDLINVFISGVGEYFIPTTGLLLNTFITVVLFTIIVFFAGTHIIGSAGISTIEFSKALTSVDTMKNFLTTLSTDQLIKLNYWNMLIFAGMCVTYFILMFYYPAMFFKNKNPFKAVFYAIKDLFSRKFFNNIILFVIICGLYFTISILSAIFSNNIIMHFVFTLLNFYYLVFGAVCIFNYYYTNFVKIGSQIDTTV